MVLDPDFLKMTNIALSTPRVMRRPRPEHLARYLVIMRIACIILRTLRNISKPPLPIRDSLLTLNRSRKHMSRHTKPHKCERCPKTFSTHNDLERHMKSVHKIAPRNGTDRSFRCAALDCTKKDKIWPRLDNFRQHCARIHKEDNIDELVRKSVLTSNTCGYT